MNFKIYKNSCIWVYRTDISNLSHRDGKPKYISKSKKNMAVLASDGPSHLSGALALPPNSHRDATTPSSCRAPRFMTQKCLIFSNPTPSKPRLSPTWRRDDEWRHTVGCHSALALHIYRAACNPSSSCPFSFFDHLCSNLSQLFHSCWITETHQKITRESIYV